MIAPGTPARSTSLKPPFRRSTVHTPLLTETDFFQDSILHSEPPSLTSQLLTLYGHASSTLVPLPPLKIYTDGSCTNVGQPNASAGSGVFFGNSSHPLNTAARVTGTQTNNRGELLAVLIAIQKSHSKRRIEIYSDSEYTIRSIVYRAPKEAQSNWTCANGDILRAIALWIASRESTIVFHHVRAHSNNAHNDAADTLAKLGSTLPLPHLPLP
ncbi:ribonuclease H-like domain-containing protein [Lentinula edodes]|nr:ribonuclease H-like domain-containing protein [Lentinula edodes]